MRKTGLTTAVAAFLFPWIPMLYLFGRNAEYLSLSQTLLLTAGMAAFSLALCGLLRLIFRSGLSALLGCLLFWVALFAFGPVRDALEAAAVKFDFKRVVLIWGGLSALVVLIACFLTRKRKGEGFRVFALLMAGVLLLLQIVQVAPLLRATSSDVETGVKTAFAVENASPSPNVYWIHCDGMLGFQAMETYYGNPQSEFKAALAARGFALDEDATLESGHKTAVAIPALLCPDFYDSFLASRLDTNEHALALSEDAEAQKSYVLQARLNNETYAAFRAKGYRTQTVASYNIYFPPIADDFYRLDDKSGSYILTLGDDPIAGFLNDYWSNELANLLLREDIGEYLVRDAEKQPLSRALENPDGYLAGGNAWKYAHLFECTYDALAAKGPKFTHIAFNVAHYPFSYDENGVALGGDKNDIARYGAHHVYAAKVLLNLIDMILADDPEAVIVLMGDHGLHGQTAAQITAAFGAEAVEPIWNQVISALRVPDQYQNGEEAQALADPRNAARYLVNRFVGRNYSYIA